MHSKPLTLLLLIAVPAMLMAQAPPDAYDELSDDFLPDSAVWSAVPKGVHFSWTSADRHHLHYDVPRQDVRRDTVLTVWRGQRVGLEALIWSRTETCALHLQPTFSGRGKNALRAEARFVRQIMTDSFRTCGAAPTNLRPFLVPDVIDLPSALPLRGMETRTVWTTVEVPHDAAPGDYRLSLRLCNTRGRTVGRLNATLRVSPRTLPEPSAQQFHLDFWQQPYAVSRYYGVKPWSAEHLALLRPYLQMLARAGQKVGTAFLFYEPWGEGKRNDTYLPMVQTTKKADGTWAYDYTDFDTWVNLLDECGIRQQINCFTMVPWEIRFRYFDEAAGEYVFLQTQTSSAEYEELWTSFLQSFARHLREKGWFEKTLIDMDERGLQNMLDAWRVAQSAVPGIKMALAGLYHKELSDKLSDYCIPFDDNFPAEEREQRRAAGQVTTFYTCCTEPHPNIFTNSPPVEAASLPLHALQRQFDGYLHWSWMDWNADPHRESRGIKHPPGDTFTIYPGPRSSVRWERFVEGVQMAEKVRLLREEFAAKADKAALQRLDEALQHFNRTQLAQDGGAEQAFRQLRPLLEQ